MEELLKLTPEQLAAKAEELKVELPQGASHEENCFLVNEAAEKAPTEQVEAPQGDQGAEKNAEAEAEAKAKVDEEAKKKAEDQKKQIAEQKKKEKEAKVKAKADAEKAKEEEKKKTVASNGKGVAVDRNVKINGNVYKKGDLIDPKSATGKELKKLGFLAE